MQHSLRFWVALVFAMAALPAFCQKMQHFAASSTAARYPILVQDGDTLLLDGDLPGRLVINGNEGEIWFASGQKSAAWLGAAQILRTSGAATSGTLSWMPQNDFIDTSSMPKSSAGPLIVNTLVSPNSMVNDYFIGGGCVEISGVSFSGKPVSRGIFSNASPTLGFGNGIVLCTGNTNYSVPGPNAGNASNGFDTNGADNDLVNLAEGGLFDVAKLEFDFVALTNSVSFDYIFASDEYCDFVGTSFNDVFGFFISGPGIPGGTANIATLPGNVEVSISNVNHFTNSSLYNSNTPSNHEDYDDPNCDFHPLGTNANANALELDGFTDVLTATATVIPCESYHIKLVIADVNDGQYDSAVFLKGNSFNAGGQVETSIVYASGASAIEGCVSGYLLVARVAGTSLTEPVTVNLTFAGTATNGVDYSGLSGSVTIPAGQNSVQVPFFALVDGISEGQETIIVTYDNPCDCNDQTDVILINDNTPLDITLANTSICPLGTGVLTPTIITGGGPYTYTWSTGASSPTLVVDGANTGTYTVTVSNTCGQSSTAAAQVVTSEAPAAILSGTAGLCNTSTATLNIDFVGTAPFSFTYAIDGGASISGTSNSNAYALPVSVSGTYTLLSVGLAGGGCGGVVSGTGTVIMGQAEVALTAIPPGCAGASLGSITASASGTGAPYTYLWNTGDTDPILVDLSPGAYTVTVTGSDGCTASESYNLNDGSDFTIAIDSYGDFNCTSPGYVDMNVIGGEAPFTFIWSDGLAATEDQGGLAAGIYTVTVSDLAGCEATAEVEIENSQSLPVLLVDSVGTMGCIPDTLPIGVMATGIGPFSYNWDGTGVIEGGNSANATVNLPGSYTVIVTDQSNGCTVSTTVVVPQNTIPPDVTLPPADPLTCEVNQVTLTAIGLDSTYVYSWVTPDGNIVSGSATANPIVNAAGTYVLEVLDPENGCPTNLSVQVSVDLTLPDITITNNGPLTCTQTTVTLTSSVTFTEPVTYVWTTTNGNIISSTDGPNTIVNNAGGYFLTVISQTNPECSTLKKDIVAGDTLWPIANGGMDQMLTCLLPSVELQSTATGTPNLDWSWSTVGGDIVSGAFTLSPLVDEAGLYIFTAVNTINNCIDVDTVVVTADFDEPTAIISGNTLLTCAQTSFVLSSEGSSAGSGFTRLWTLPNGSTAGNPTILVTEPGTYSLQITNNSNGCVDNESVTVLSEIEYPILDVISPLQLTCSNDFVVLDVNASPNLAYTYAWITSSGGVLVGDTDFASPNATAAGTYSVTVTHPSNGCTATAFIQVVLDNVVPNVSIQTPATWFCGTDSLEISANSIAGNTDIVFVWEANPGVIQGNEVGQTISITAPGEYLLNAIDTSNNCESQTSVVIPVDTISPQLSVSPLLLGCTTSDGIVNGTILNDDGGSYSYYWFSVDGNEGIDSSSLSAVIGFSGTFVLTVVDVDNGCEGEVVSIVTSSYTPPSLSILPTLPINCIKDSTFINAYVLGSLTNVGWVWTGPNPNSILSGLGTSTIVVQDTGLYKLTVINLDNGCFRSDTIYVLEDFQSPVAVIAPPDVFTCSIAEIVLDASASTGSALEFEWSTSQGFISSATNLASPTVTLPATYSLLLTNQENGCTDSISVQVMQDVNLPFATIAPPDPLTCVVTSLVLDASASSTGSNYAYQWINESNLLLGEADTLTVLTTGVYKFTVTDTLNGCVVSSQIEVIQDIVPPSANIENAANLTCAVSSLELMGLGSAQQGTVSYSWSTFDGQIESGALSSEPTVTASGVYELTVTATANGCTAMDQVYVGIDTVAPVITQLIPDSITCNIATVNLQAQLVGNNSVNVIWSTGNGQLVGTVNSLNATAAAIGYYQIQVTQAQNGCTSTASTSVGANFITPIVDASTGPDFDCSTTSLAITATASGIGDLQFAWTSIEGVILGATSQLELVVGAPGSYQLEVTDSYNGCSATDFLIVGANFEAPELSIMLPATLNCTLSSIVLETQSTVSTLQYVWSASNGGQFLSNSTSDTAIAIAPGTYQVVVTDPSNNCTNSAITEVTQDIVVPMVDAGANDTLTCSITQVALSGTAAAQNPLTYLWSSVNGSILSGANTLTPTVTESGTYQLLATNTINGCSAFDTVFVGIDTLQPTAQIETPTPLTCSDLVAVLQATISQNAGIVFTWSGPVNGIVGNGNSLTPTVGLPGSYALALSDIQNGCQTQTEVVVEQDTLVPEVFAGADDSLSCAFVTLLLQGSAQNVIPGSTKYEWFTNNGLIIGSPTNPSIEVGQPGDYQLEVTNLINGCFDFDFATIGIDTVLPMVALVEPQILTCYTPNIEIDGTASSTSEFMTYNWTTNNGNIVAEDGPTAIVNQPGNYQLQLQNSNNGCLDQTEVQVFQNIVQPYVDAGPDLIISCFTQTATLLGDTIGANVSFDWSANNSQDLALGVLQPDISLEGEYVLTTTNLENGCTKIDVAVAIQAQPPTPFFNVVSPLCEQITGEIKIDSVQGGTPPFVFSLNNGPYYPALVYTLLLPNIYTIQTQDAEGCLFLDTLNVLQPPLYTANIVANTDSWVLGDSIFLSSAIDLPSDSIVSIAWMSPQTNLSCYNCPNTSAAPTFNAYFEVNYLIYNGCNVTANFTAAVDTIASLYFPNAFTPNGDGENDFFYPFYGENDAKIKKVNVLQVFDRWGTLHFEQRDFAPNNPSNGWDGTLRGSTLMPAVFTWQAEIELITGRRIFMYGDITLLR